MKRVSEIYFWYPFYLCQVYKATSIVRFSPLDLWTMTLSSLHRGLITSLRTNNLNRWIIIWFRFETLSAVPLHLWHHLEQFQKIKAFLFCHSTLPNPNFSCSIIAQPSEVQSELEKERNFATADKIKAEGIKKLSKQNLYLPPSIMDMVLMTKKLYAVISLCFGKEAHSSTFLKDWADHMYENRLMYTSIQAADPYFFTKVLFAIVNALQIHWRLCSSVNICQR